MSHDDRVVLAGALDASVIRHFHITVIRRRNSVEMDTSVPLPLDGNVSNGTGTTLNGAPSNGDSNGHVVTNAPGMSAGLLREGPELSCLC